MVLPAALLAAACSAPAPRAAPEAKAPPKVQPSDDAAYDWHGLVIAPFGSVLKEVPGTLHEVLLFRDDAHQNAPAEEAECYAVDAAAPRFVGRTPDEYLLCFRHDRLSRIQASVQVPVEEAPGVFAAACAAWLRHAAHTGGACEGSDGAIHFSGRLAGETALSITLDVPDT